MSETVLDVKGLNCPLPVLRANRSLRGMAPGERLRVLATDRAAVADFHAYLPGNRPRAAGLVGGGGGIQLPDPPPRRRPAGAGGRAIGGRMGTALFTHPACLGHEPGPWHPERPDRLRAVLAALEGEAFAPLLREVAPEATRDQLALAHPATYVDAILAIRPEPGETVALDADTAMSAGSAAAALRAAGGRGGGGRCGDGRLGAHRLRRRAPAGAPRRAGPPDGLLPVQQRRYRRARGRGRAGGCAGWRWWISTSITATARRRSSGRMRICSTHPRTRVPCYPGTGSVRERGVAGNVVNAPLAPGSDGAAFRAAWSGTLLPALAAFAPELVIVSAGFDAHKADPLAELLVETADFAWITQELLDLTGGRLVSVLEGGYDLDALAAAAAAHVRVLMGAG